MINKHSEWRRYLCQNEFKYLGLRVYCDSPNIKQCQDLSSRGPQNQRGGSNTCQMSDNSFLRGTPSRGVNAHTPAVPCNITGPLNITGPCPDGLLNYVNHGNPANLSLSGGDHIAQVVRTFGGAPIGGGALKRTILNVWYPGIQGNLANSVF